MHQHAARTVQGASRFHCSNFVFPDCSYFAARLGVHSAEVTCKDSWVSHGERSFPQIREVSWPSGCATARDCQSPNLWRILTLDHVGPPNNWPIPLNWWFYGSYSTIMKDNVGDTEILGVTLFLHNLLMFFQNDEVEDYQALNWWLHWILFNIMPHGSTYFLRGT